MIENLSALGYGIISFAVLVGIGLVILYSMGTNLATCPTGYTYNTNGTATYTSNLCCNNSASTCSGTANSTNPSTATQNLNTMGGYLGTGSGGLSTWIPIIIVMVVGLLFLSWFIGRKVTKA